MHHHAAYQRRRRCVTLLTAFGHRCVQEFSEATLPVLANLLHTLLADTSGQAEVAVLMRTVLKIFWSCIYIEIPDVLSSHADLSRQWLKVLAFLFFQCLSCCLDISLSWLSSAHRH